MKLNETYMIREFNGTVYAVAVDSKSEKEKKPILLNKTARILWEELSEDVSEEDLIDALLEEYEITRQTAEIDTKEFLSVIRKAGLLTE